MAEPDGPIGPDEYRKRIADLCARGGRHAVPRRARDRWILLHALSRVFEGSAPLSEKDVDARIQSWLLQTGRALETDHVALRRALVDEGFVTRDPGGSDYGPSTAYESRFRFDPAVLAIDPDAVIEDEHSRARERRRLKGTPAGEP